MNRVNVIEAQQGKPQPSIIVMGSCFMDYVAYVERAPQIGETLHSENFQKGFGGKGANQAVAAGRLGAQVGMVGIVGGDGDGAEYLKQLSKNGVNITNMFRKTDESSGLAMIFVETTSSNNEIVICPNVTHRLTPEFLRKQTNNYETIFTKDVKFLVVQNEIPLATTLDALKVAHSRGIYTIFNSAPAPKPAEVEKIRPYLRYVSLFCPNEVEAQLITGIKVTDAKSAFKALAELQRLGVRDAVITLGASGFVISTKGEAPIHVPGIRVKAVDTTGAGDCFVGSMVFFLNKGLPLLEACKKANICAAYSVQRKGTQASYPKPSNLPRGTI